MEKKSWGVAYQIPNSKLRIARPKSSALVNRLSSDDIHASGPLPNHIAGFRTTTHHRNLRIFGVLGGDQQVASAAGQHRGCNLLTGVRDREPNIGNLLREVRPIQGGDETV